MSPDFVRECSVVTPKSYPDGPFEELTWPTQLLARVVTPEGPPHLHGYAVDDDLARNYRFGEVLLLALTGQPPSPEVGAFFEGVLVILSPVCVAEAPVHAALLSRSAGARPVGTLLVGLVGLAEQARHLVETHQGLLEAAARGTIDSWPEGFEARTERDVLVGRELEERWPWPPAPTLGNITAEGALLVALFACGLTAPWQMEAALVTSRLGTLSAEAHAAPLGRLMDYPMNLPPFEYLEDQDETETQDNTKP